MHHIALPPPLQEYSWDDLRLSARSGFVGAVYWRRVVSGGMSAVRRRQVRGQAPPPGAASAPKCNGAYLGAVLCLAVRPIGCWLAEAPKQPAELASILGP